jgi:UDP-4-amino-4,6-dideoxy-N-acetyl-beta-L-altrosamine transaminase
MIPYSRQEITEADIAEVEKVLRSDFLTQGPTVPKFEKSVADYCGTSYSIAVNSATSALHIACLALDLGPGDWLWTSPNTFVASANCGLYCGASVDFVDIDPLTYNLCPNELEKKLIQAKQDSKLPKILIPVHFAGQSCDMKKIYSLSQEYGFKVIEDASHSIGGKYLNHPIGSCQYSDITVFSFHPVKIITTGEGGMALTNNAELSRRMCYLRTHGITRDEALMQPRPENEIWNYQQIELGFNYRMSEIPGALGVSQMKRLDDFVCRRHYLQERYHQMLSDLPIILPHQSKDSYSALHLYPIQIDLDKVSKTHSQVFDELSDNGLGVNLHYIPVHIQPYYQNLGFKYGDFPNSENYFNRAISIPLFYAMTLEQQDEVVRVLKEILISNYMK